MQVGIVGMGRDAVIDSPYIKQGQSVFSMAKSLEVKGHTDPLVASAADFGKVQAEKLVAYDRQRFISFMQIMTVEGRDPRACGLQGFPEQVDLFESVTNYGLSELEFSGLVHYCSGGCGHSFW